MWRSSPGLAAFLNRLLPPNQVSVVLGRGDDSPTYAKCAVISLSSFLRDTSEERKDHFCIGRLFQPTEILEAAPEAEGEQILDAIIRAHLLTFSWVRPWLPARFDVATYCRTLLEVSLSREIRPESSGRATQLFEAGREYMEAVYRILLDDLAKEGRIVAEGESLFSLAQPVSRGERARLECYFGWSLVRATVRWGKYMITFDDWLEYIVRKARRHSGEEIVLTPLERRLPLLFLWPRLIRFFRRKDRR